MVGWIRLRESRELVILCPVEVSSVDDYAPHYRTVASDEFRRGVDHYVCAVLDRSQQERCRECVVYDERNAVFVGYCRYRFNVDHI